jgi:hypothetical protein
VIASLALAFIAFVPMDDRPVTWQLPVLLGRIAGERVVTPPATLLGHYYRPGKPDAIIAWLNTRARDASSFVISTDMLAYGGLLASRVPGPTYADAIMRLRELAHLRAEHPKAWIAAFATIMRLAPTAAPAGSGYFAAYPVWRYLQEYANLHDPPLPAQEARAARLRALIGEPALAAYMASRMRDLGADRMLLSMAAAGAIDRLVLGQDDAGPVGLHVPDLHLLQAELDRRNLDGRASIEPGADELGMALVAHALALRAHWTPRIAVRYSRPDGAAFRDPLEYAPISTAIGNLIRLCGGVQVDDGARPQIVLYVRVPYTSAAQDDAFLEAIAADIAAGRSVAIADLSFLHSYASQADFARRLLASGIAAHLDAYASWNTNANTDGTALAEAVAAGAGRRLGTYDDLAHRTFTFMRFLDDYAFHDEVRGPLNTWLAAQGIEDHSYLAPGIASETAARNRALLWSYATSILSRLDPGYHIAALSITLPWDRTFETRIDAGIAPDLP